MESTRTFDLVVVARGRDWQQQQQQQQELEEG